MSKALLISLAMLSAGFFSFATGLVMALKGPATGTVMTISVHFILAGAILFIAGFLFMGGATIFKGIDVIGEIDDLVSRMYKTIKEGVVVSKEWLMNISRVAKAVAIDSVTKAPGRTGMAFVLAGIAFIVMAIIAENRDFAVQVAAFIGIVALVLGAMTITAAYLGKDAENSA